MIMEPAHRPVARHVRAILPQAAACRVPAAADTFPGAGLLLADDAIHTYCLTSSFFLEEHKLVPEYAMYWLDQTTQMSDSPKATCVNSTDAKWYKTDLPPGYRGLAECAVVGDIPTVCDRTNLHLDFVELDIGGLDWEDRRKTACHELGHSVGLNHHPAGSSEGCMVSGEIPSADVQWRRYTTHDVGHINAAY